MKKFRDVYGTNPKKVFIYGAIILFIFVTILSSFQTIESGEVGLKVRFGKIVDSSLNEGLNLKIPYIEEIKKVNIKVQKVEIPTESSTKDMQLIDSTIAVNYRVDSQKASNLYRTVGNTYEQTVLTPAIQESIKSAIAQYNAEEITTKRSEVSKKCLEALQSKVEKYGIIVEDFNLTDFNFSAEYTKAIEEKQVAEQKLQKAKLEAEAKVIEAEATKKANDLMKQSLTKELIEKQMIEKWDGKLPTTYAGDNVMGMFNLK
ncbi:MAG: prohibitin family protein [Bacilli bacterium]|nr:prohibitin family protein [Bacilli bacterium]